MIETKDDLTGKRFGRLVVIGRAEDYIEPSGKHRARWWCQCDCGSEPVAICAYVLKRKKNPTISCGCWKRESISIRSKKTNKYDLSGTYGIGWTNNTNKEFYFDIEDYDLIKNYCWCETVATNGYRYLSAWDCKTKTIIKMHWILGCKGYDHHDRNALNNCRSNLVPCTSQENNRNRSLSKNNTSGFIGVSWNKSVNKWVAVINVKSEGSLYLGSYDNKIDAIKARLKAEYEIFKDFSPQRHLFNEYHIVEDDNNE